MHVTARIATEDVEIGGEIIREGEQVVAVLGAANRDPDQFPDPDRLDVGRTPNRHLGLGGGPHFCLGAALARIEGQIAFDTLLRRFPDLELATEDPTYRDHFVIRGLTDLKVSITRRRLELSRPRAATRSRRPRRFLCRHPSEKVQPRATVGV